MIWKKLPQSELEKLIGNDVLSQISEIGPAVFPEGNVDIFLKANLVKLANAFVTIEHLQSKVFRKLLFNCIPEDNLKVIFQAAFPKIRVPATPKAREALINTGWNDTEYCKRITTKINLGDWLIPEQRVKIEEKKEVLAPAIPFKQLKAYQFSIFDDTVETLSIPNSRCILQMPTGSGKTRTAMEIVCHFLNKYPEKKVLWIAHSSELCEQAVESFEQIWSHLGQKNTSVVRFWSSTNSQKLNETDSRFIVCSYGKLFGLKKKDFQQIQTLASQTSLIVIDEAHMAVAPKYKELIGSLRSDQTRMLGLTATPGRADKQSTQELSEFFFNKLLTLTAPKGVPILEYLRTKGVLSKVVHITLGGARVELSSTQLKKIASDSDFTPEFLKQLGKDKERNLQIIKALKTEAISGNKILYFAPSIEQSKFICSFLIYLGIQAAHIDGEMGQSQRRSLIEKFKNGELSVLCNYGVLTTGFDAPKTNVVVIARPTQSVVLYSQMIGRGLRGPAIGGTESCKVIEVIDNFINLPKFNALHDYFEEYFEAQS